MFLFKSKPRKMIPLLMCGLLIASAALQPKASASTANQQAAVPLEAKQVEAFVDEFFNRPQNKEQLTGAAVVLVKGDKVLFQKGYGYADIGGKKPIDAENSVFRVASISKLFTATAVMQLVEQGKIDLQGDVQAYLGDLKIPNKTGKTLTMEHLLTHTTGFDYTDSPNLSEKEVPNNQFIKEQIPTIVRDPGEAYRYDNYAFNLQGYIVERLSGVPFSQYVQKHILEPLGMESSSFQMTSELREHLATPYTAKKEPIPEYLSYPAEAPDGGMFSTGGDMAKFMIAQLNGGQLADARILSQESVKNMQQIHHRIHPQIPGTAYGFETFYSNNYNGQSVIGKGGDLSGYHSWMWLMPEQKVGGFIVVNGDGTNLRENFFAAFMDHFYPETPKQKSYLKPSKTELSQLTGVYQDLRIPFWVFQVTVTDDGLLNIVDPYGSHTLREIEPMLFEDEQGIKAAIKVNSNGTQYLYYNKVDSWAKKAPEPKEYTDVSKQHPYAPWIYGADQLGFLNPSADGVFHPEQEMTRAEFIAELMRMTGLAPAKTTTLTGEAGDAPYLGFVQRAMDLGFVQGNAKSNQAYNTSQIISRQEAAILIWRAAMTAGVNTSKSSDVKLLGKTDPWAMEAVQYIVNHGMYGPEVTKDSAGIDYRSKQPLLRQEAAVLLNLFCKKLSL